ncbi:SoxR reducing system RseC family protein [Colwelliaceae bacterium BS250]
MIEETAKVVAIDGDKITVTSSIKSTCHSCAQQDDCGSGQIAKAIPHKSLTTSLNAKFIGNKILNVGDEVVIGLPETTMLSSAFDVYMLPIIGLVLFAAIGQYVLVDLWHLHELLALMLGVFGGVLGFLIAKKRQKVVQVQQDLQPKLLRKCADIIPVTII